MSNFRQILQEITACFTDEQPRPVSHNLLTRAFDLATDECMIKQVHEASKGPATMSQEQRTKVGYDHPNAPDYF